jgi:hypothetical protein
MNRILEFKTMEFKDGLNLTVRNGDKWRSVKVGEILDIQETGSKKTTKRAKVEAVKTCLFTGITPFDLECEHDPSCRTLTGLVDAMDRAYGPCNWGPGVTLVFFTIIPSGWIGVDLDGTLAVYDGWKGANVIGDPVPLMVNRVKQWLKEGRDVRIFTARISHDGTQERIVDAVKAHGAITSWCVTHIGQELPVTCYKDYSMVELWDDRCAGCTEHRPPCRSGAGRVISYEYLTSEVDKIHAHALGVSLEGDAPPAPSTSGFICVDCKHKHETCYPLGGYCSDKETV